MLRSLKHTTFIFMVTLTLILSYAPTPVTVSSLPIVVFQDHSHAYNTFHVDDKLAFDVSFAFVLLIALGITGVWIVARVTIDLFTLRVNRLLATSVELVGQVADLLYYLRLDNIASIGTSILIDANDFRRDLTRLMGGVANGDAAAANPTSTAAPSRRFPLRR